jgi:hypothetical protein
MSFGVNLTLLFLTLGTVMNILYVGYNLDKSFKLYVKILIIKIILGFLSPAVRYLNLFFPIHLGIIEKPLIPRCAFWRSEFH